ncbi:MAG TPA: ATP-binding cassette domain-containing protein [Bacteroidales bacterium]|jgi:ABC-type branched-subunit amino acid transport system ATPase component|nr:ATP-binding cassette domain-containing protein [Bacteroidales bacterium]
MDNILEISDLSLSFIQDHKKDESLYLFKDLKLEIPGEKVTALVGGNGVGKTTLFNIINGIQRGTSGKLIFKGKNITGLSPYQIALAGIGRLFQGARIFDELSILDNMLMGCNSPEGEIPFYNILFASRVDKAERRNSDKAEKIFIELFGEDNIFWKSRQEPAGVLSFGQQRLLALARLLMGDYSLYLLDEPTSGINVNFLGQIASTIRKMNSHSCRTVLMIEHNMQFVRLIAENCLFMANGEIIAKGSPAEVLDNGEVQKIYMGF